MNIDEFKTYRFAAGSLTEVKTGKNIDFLLMKMIDIINI